MKKYNKQIVIPDDLENEIVEAIGNKTVEFYWDTRSPLGDRNLKHIAEHGIDDWANHIEEMNWDGVSQYEREGRKEVIEEFMDRIDCDPEDIDIVCDLFDDVYPVVDMRIKDLIAGEFIPGKIVLHSNFDCINSFWLEFPDGYSWDEDKQPDSYAAEVFEALNINPREFQLTYNEMRDGELNYVHWPKIAERQGKARVDLNKWIVEEENRSCGACLLYIPIQIPLEWLYENESLENVESVVVPKGTNIGYFSSWQGGGSLLECPLLDDWTIQIADKKGYGFALLPEDGHTPKQVYGADNSIYQEVTLNVKQKVSELSE